MAPGRMSLLVTSHESLHFWLVGLVFLQKVFPISSKPEIRIESPSKGMWLSLVLGPQLARGNGLTMPQVG